MLEELITDINSFSEKQIDHDIITQEKTYFSIYNNKIEQPFHKFWFNVPNTKFFKNYSDYNVLRFALNNKSNFVSKLIDFIKKLSTSLKNIFEKTFEGIQIDLPWKEYENYPYLFSFYTNEDIIFTDSEKNILTLDKLDLSQTYSLLFEIKNLKLVKIEIDNIFTYKLKYNLNILMIQQEPQLNLKSFLLSKINKQPEPVFNSNNSTNNLNHNPNSSLKPQLPFLSQLSNVVLKSESDTRTNNSEKPKVNIGGPKKLIDLDEILQIKSRLIKVNLDSEKNPDEDNKSNKTNANLENTLMEQKSQLKKVKTKEKSLLKHLEKQSKKKKKHDKTIKENLDLELELEKYTDNQLDIEFKKDKKIKSTEQDTINLENELEEYKENKDIKKKDKKDKKNKKDKKDKKKVEKESDDLEKELEMFG